MDFGFEGFESAGFDVDVEEVTMKKTKKFDRVFRVSFGGSINQRPLVFGDLIIFGSMDHFLYAIDSKTGMEAWRTKANGIFFESSPITDGKTIFIGNYDYNLYAVDARNGKVLWRFKTGGEILGTPALDEKNVYIGSRDGNLYCVDKMTGSEKWRFRTGDWVVATPLVNEGKVYIGSFDCNFYCLNSGDGKEVWRFKTGAEIYDVYPGSIINGRIFVPSFDNNLYCLDSRTGKEIWRFAGCKYGTAAAPIFYKNILYHETRDGILYALSMDGKEIWRFKAGGLIGMPVFRGSRMYVGSADKNLYCLDMNGKEVWRFRTDGDVFWQPVIKDGVIYFTSWDCHLYAVNVETREELWRFATSTKTQAEWPPAFEGWEAEIKKATHIEDAISEDRYKSKHEKSVSLSDYHVKSDYATTSEYKQKSDYDTQWVMFENVMEDEEIWTLDLKVLTPDFRTSM
ncbi:MAG: PQQ-binding-like beta-propeller repeat protein [Candidatus Aenigmarchaeota archaeon]|nr:PQQ-binding-like beta-propeller repeat protein [Candidatus Aenigmarchaeota archaeon]